MVIIYCCWGGHFKKRKIRIEIYLAISFFLLVLFIYISFFLSFLFLLSSFPSFVFFCQHLGGIAPPPLRSATGFTQQFHSFYLFCLFTFPFFSLFFFSFPLFPLLYFFVSLWGGGGGGIAPSPPPQIRHWIYPTISFFLLVLFIYFSLFLSFLFLLSSFSSFVFFLSAFEGGSPHRPPSDPPLDLPRNFILSTCFVYLLFLFSLFSFSPFLFSLFFIFFVSLWGGGGDRPHRPPLRSATAAINESAEPAVRVHSDRMRCDFFAANNRIKNYACVKIEKIATQWSKLSMRFYACVCVKNLITSWSKIL